MTKYFVKYSRYIYRFFQTLNCLGFFNTLKFLFYEKIKSNKKFIKLNLKSQSIFLRPNTSDFGVFSSIYIDLDYPFFTNFKPQLIIDGGANAGFASLYFSELYPDSSIISIEPDFENFDLLLKNISFQKNIIPLNKAIWSDNCELIINKSSKNKDSLKVINVDQATQNASFENTSNFISSTTIDKLIIDYNIKKIDILKLDIEGAEREVFSSNTNWLEIVDILIIEIHEDYSPGSGLSVLKAISNFNFLVYKYGENLLFIKNNLKVKFSH